MNRICLPLALLVLSAACSGPLPFVRPGETRVELLRSKQAADTLGRVDGTFDDCGEALRKAGLAWTRSLGLEEEQTDTGATLGVEVGTVRARAPEGVLELRYRYAWDRQTADLRLDLLPAEGQGGAPEELKAHFRVSELLPKLRDALRCDDPDGAP